MTAFESWGMRGGVLITTTRDRCWVIAHGDLFRIHWYYFHHFETHLLDLLEGSVPEMRIWSIL